MGVTIDRRSGGGGGSGIAYALIDDDITHNGLSQFDFDHGWLKTLGWLTMNNPVNPEYHAKLVNNTTLENNNIHGTTDRYTFTNGTNSGWQPSTNQIVQDHYFGREYYCIGLNAIAGGVPAAVVDPNTQVFLGRTGWNLITIDHILRIGLVNPSVDPFSYLPARPNAGPFVTSSMRIDGTVTNRAYYYTGNREISARTVSDLGHTSTGHAIYVRKFTGY